MRPPVRTTCVNIRLNLRLVVTVQHSPGCEQADEIVYWGILARGGVERIVSVNYAATKPFGAIAATERRGGRSLYRIAENDIAVLRDLPKPVRYRNRLTASLRKHQLHGIATALKSRRHTGRSIRCRCQFLLQRVDKVQNVVYRCMLAAGDKLEQWLVMHFDVAQGR